MQLSPPIPISTESTPAHPVPPAPVTRFSDVLHSTLADQVTCMLTGPGYANPKSQTIASISFMKPDLANTLPGASRDLHLKAAGPARPAKTPPLKTARPDAAPTDTPQVKPETATAPPAAGGHVPPSIIGTDRHDLRAAEQPITSSIETNALEPDLVRGAAYQIQLGQLNGPEDFETPAAAATSGPDGSPVSLQKNATAKPLRGHADTGAIAHSTAPDTILGARQSAFGGAAPDAVNHAAQTVSNGVSPLGAVAGDGRPAMSNDPAGTLPVVPSQTTDAAPAPPTAQIGHAMAAMHTGSDGSSHVSIRLDPMELGLVQVRIVRAHDGAASVCVTVERPETLGRLQTDLGHLHQMLDRAGLPERNVTLNLAAPDASSTSQSGPGHTGASGQGSSQHGSSQHGNFQHGNPGPGRNGAVMSPSGHHDHQNADAGSDNSPTRWLRAGVNITA